MASSDIFLSIDSNGDLCYNGKLTKEITLTYCVISLYPEFKRSSEKTIFYTENCVFGVSNYARNTSQSE